VAAEPTRANIEDALPLFIMYVGNAAEHAAGVSYEARTYIATHVYGELHGVLDKRGEAERSPLRRGLSLMAEVEARGAPPADLGAYYSLLFSVVTVVQIYVSGMPVMRMSLAPLYGLARASLARLATAP